MPNTPKFVTGDAVVVEYKKYKPGVAVLSVIVSEQWWRNRHMMPNYFLYYFQCSPLELEGLEHDDSEWFYEANIRRSA